MKLRIWQALITLMQLFEPPHFYSPEFRGQRLSFVSSDVVAAINKQLWISLEQTHIPSIRQYIEIFAVKFCLAFPEDTIL